MNIIRAFFELINTPDIDTVIAYQYKMPSNIGVQIRKDGDIYFAKINKINDDNLTQATIVTEAKTVDKLVASVNDALLTYLDFPENIKSHMPLFLPPEVAKNQLESLQTSKSSNLILAK